MKPIGLPLLFSQSMLVLAQQNPLLVPSDFIPSVATITRVAEPTPFEADASSVTYAPSQVRMNSVIFADKSLSQCGPSVTCHIPILPSFVTIYDTTLTEVRNTTKTESQYYTNTVVDLWVEVISETIAHEGICTRDVTVVVPTLVITVSRNITSTNYYLTETTTRSTTKTTVNVTSSHACTKSAPPIILPIEPAPPAGDKNDNTPGDNSPGDKNPSVNNAAGSPNEDSNKGSEL